MEEPILDQQTENKPKRPNLLTVLCILTFISSGMNMLSGLVIAGFYDTFVLVAQDFAERFKIPGIDLLLETKPLFFLVSSLFYAGSLTGAIMMINLKKTGFHIYTISQILLLLAPMYFMHLSGPGFPELFFTALFVLLYSTNLKVLS